MQEDYDKQIQNNDDKKKTRRTRKDEEGRNYTCPCGKSYLSYPALYTHVKTKHQGKTPKDGQSAVKASDQFQEIKNPLSIIKEIINKQFSGEQSNTFTTPLNSQDSQYIESIVQNWEDSKQTKLDDQSNNSLESINNIFGRFLCQFKAQADTQPYLYLCHFISTFHNAINEQKQNENFCDQPNGSQLPHFFNEIILKKKVPKFESRKDSSANSLTIACKILFYFGIWIFDERYTNYSVKFNIAH